MNYVKSLNLFGVEAKEIPCITGSGAPTASTVGAVGLLYMNTDNGDVYKCTAVSGNAYTWEAMTSSSSDSGGNGIDYFIVNATSDQADKTFGEIRAAVRDEGKTPVLFYDGMMLSYCGSTDTAEKFYQWLARGNNETVEYELLEAQIESPNTVVFKSTPGELADGQSSGGNVDLTATALDYDRNVPAVNHRGYNTVAPENTIPAFILSKKMGFNRVECDVYFTTDNVCVVHHDTTIDRTSNGTGYIYQKSYSELMQYDFGSWKSAQYTGTKISTLEELLLTCKGLGLHLYIEIEPATTSTQTNVESIIALVKKTGMRKNVTYISFSATHLGYVKNVDASARLGYNVETVTSTGIETLSGLKTDNNEVFMNCNQSELTDAMVTLCVNADIPLEVWVVNDTTWFDSMNPYITGVTSDSLIAGKILLEKYGIYSAPDEPDSPADPDEPASPDAPAVPEGYSLVRNLYSDDLQYGRSTDFSYNASAVPPYTQAKANRIGYLYQDILVESGYTYRFEFNALDDLAQIGTQWYNETCMAAMANNSRTGDVKDPGWCENGVEIAITDTDLTVVGTGNQLLTGTPFKCVRLAFRRSDDATPADGYIQSVTISRKPTPSEEPDTPEVPEEPDVPVLEGREWVNDTIMLTSDDLSYGLSSQPTAPTSNPPYTYAVANRAGYYHQDILVEYGYKYKFEFVSEYETAQIGTQWYNETVMEAINAGTAFAKSEVLDPGWQSSGYEYVVPELHNGVPLVCVRLAFRLSTANPAFSGGEIQSVTITRTPV